MELPKSPVTKTGQTKIIDTFFTEDIVRLYRQQENLDVADFFRFGETVYLLECEDTGYRFYFPFEVAGDEDFYQKLKIEADKKGLEYDRDWSPDHDFAFTQIETDEKLLEIGCNTGKFLEKIREKTDFAEGAEFNPIAAETARKKGLRVRNIDITELVETEAETFDVVCGFQVLEHITNIEPFLSAAIKLLKKGGKLIFSVPNNEPYFQRFSKYEVLNLPPHHVGMWNLESFEKLTNFYEISLDNYAFTGRSSFKADIYLRSKLMADVKSIPKKHTFGEKAKIFALAPVSVVFNSFDVVRGKAGYGHITVVFRKT